MRIWCAGCSTGQEAYMLLMFMFEFFGREYGLWDAGILATDLSDRALSVAKAGIYPEEQVKLVPENLKRKYFKKIGNAQWAIDSRCKKETVFRRFNLINKQYPFRRPFHMIFCRNVMIYFDQTTRNTLINKFYQFTEPGGYLFIGHSETITRNQDLYKYIAPAIYKRLQ
ncbi:MAG: CheR family methyltransferase [bacterium]